MLQVMVRLVLRILEEAARVVHDLPARHMHIASRRMSPPSQPVEARSSCRWLCSSPSKSSEGIGRPSNSARTTASDIAATQSAQRRQADSVDFRNFMCERDSMPCVTEEVVNCTFLPRGNGRDASLYIVFIWENRGKRSVHMVTLSHVRASVHGKLR